MNKIITTVIALGFITGCSVVGSVGNSSGASSQGGSSANSSGGRSSGSFGQKRVKEVALEQPKVIVDNRTLVPLVTKVQVDPFQGGVIVSAVGTANQAGYGNVDLVPVNKGLPDEEGVVTYEFKGDAPYGNALVTTKRSKEFYAGISINSVRLPSIKRIRVIAAENQITVAK